MSVLFTIPSSPPEMVKKQVAVPCPVSGKPCTLDSLGDKLLASGVFGHGHALVTGSSQINAPLPGRVIRTDPLAYALTLRTRNGLLLRIKVGLNTESLMGEKCQFTVCSGDDVTAGDTLFTISPPYFKQQGITPVCVVTVLNSENASAVVANTQSHCRALDDTLLTVYV